MPQPIDEYRETMSKQAKHHANKARLLHGLGVGHNVPDDTLRRLRLHEVWHLACLYGLTAERVEGHTDAIPKALESTVGRFVPSTGGFLVAVDKDDKDPAKIGPRIKNPRFLQQPDFEGVAEHRLTTGWGEPALAVDRLEQSTHGLNLELRGVSRALWLAALWLGYDVGVIRPQWYHWTEVGPYWLPAWECVRHPGALPALLAYGEAVCDRYASLHPKSRQHAALEYVRAVRGLHNKRAQSAA